MTFGKVKAFFFGGGRRSKHKPTKPSPAHLNLHACSALFPQDTGFFREGWPVRGRFSPSCAWPQPRLLHPHGRPGCAQNSCNAKQTRRWCPPPVGRGSPCAKISIRILSSGSGSIKSKSRNMALATILPPAPCRCEQRHSLLRTPENPALAHGVRW